MRYLAPPIAIVAVALCCTSLAFGQIPDLADSLEQPSTVAPESNAAILPPVTVRPSAEPAPSVEGDYSGGFGTFPGAGRFGYNPSPNVSWGSGAIVSDQQLVGPYGQPVWTTQRPFATTRAYVLPAGTAQFEQWVRPTWNEGDPVKFRMLEEFSIGLPYRFQLDLYQRWNIEGEDHNASHEGVQIELRWALADWGVIPLNPTLYAEWVERGGPQEKPNKYELKLLLADSLLDNLYFASNYVLEQETSGERETELGWSNALSTTVIERTLLAGVECVLNGTTVEGDRGNWTPSFLIGPSMQIRPTNRTFIDLVALGGTTPRDSSPEAQMYIVFGYQFGLRAGPAGRYAGGSGASYASMFGGSGNISGPASTRGN